MASVFLWSCVVIWLRFAGANTSRFLDSSTRSQLEDVGGLHFSSFNKNNDSFEIETAPQNSSLPSSWSITLSSTFFKEEEQLQSSTITFQKHLDDLMYDLNNGSASVNISTSNDSILMTSSKLVNLQETTESLKESSFTTMSVKSPIHSYDTFEDPSLSASSGSLSENISDIGPDVFMLPNEHMNMSYTDFEEDLASFVAEYGNFSDTVIEEHPELPTVPDTIVKSSSLNTKPDVSVTSAISTSSSTRIFERSSNRKQHRKQTGYQDIISGLVKLLGGKNVQVANSGSVSKDPARGALSASSRINHRAPPRITFAEPNTTIPPTSTMPLSVQGTFSSSDSNSFTGTDNAPSLLGFSNDHSLDPSEPLVVITSISSTVTVQTTRTDRPTGPITEWLPANGKHPVGYKPSISTTTIKNQPSVAQESSTFSAISLKSSTIKKDDSILDITKTGTKNAFSPETEVSYAGIAPSTTLPPSYKTSSKSSSSSLSSLSSSSSSSPPPSRAVLSESNTQSKEATSPLPMSNTDGIVTTSRSGVVLPVISKRQSSTRLSESVTTIVTRYHNHHPFPTRQPTGSPFVIPVDIHEIELKNDGKAEDPIIHGTKRPSSNDQSVFIHGQKTYFNLMPSETRTSGDSTLVNVGIGYSFPSNNNKRPPVGQGSVSNVELPQSKPINRPQPAKVPQIIKNTPVRIDTCIIGDEAACNVQLNETCRVEAGVSSCNCRLGYGRDGLEQGCKPVVGLTVYIKVDKVNTDYISFGAEYEDPNSAKYQMLEYEAKQAVDSVFSLSALAENYVGSNINAFFSVGGRVIINATVHLLESPQTRSPTIKQEIRRGLISVIRQQNQNIGQSRLYVDGPLNPIPGVQDVDECSDPNLNDCSKNAVCSNSFGSFKCSCQDGFLDKYPDDSRRSGRICSVCSPQYCNNRGECVITNGIKECKCHGNFIGSQCETDGEVLGVALGASLAALAIIVLTLICLCMWSRRWKRDQKKMLGKPSSTGIGNTYNYFSKSNIQPDFHLPQEDRMRWPQSSDTMDNFYAPEPISANHNSRMYNTSRPPLPSAPPPSTGHRAVQALRSLPSLGGSRSNILDDTDEDDQGQCDTNPRFHFPRPKSRISQTGPNAYYDSSFSKNTDHYNYDKEYGVINAFPMKSMRPFHK